LGFPLLLLITTVIFLMPGAFVPELTDVPFFNILTLSCLAASFPRVLGQLTARSLARNPITACVVGLLAAVVLSYVSQANLTYARYQGTEFAKIVIFYLVVVANIDTPRRLQRYLPWMALMITALAGCSLLQYHGLASLAAQLEPTLREQDFGIIRDGQRIVLRQLRGVGFFQDPNDICLVLVAGVFIALYRLSDLRRGMARFLWLVPLGILVSAFPLTHSRGGMVALLAGLLALLFGRFGPWRTIPIALAVVPALMLLLSGRQTALEATEGTAQQRIQFWTIGLGYFRARPLFGIGSGLFVDFVDHEAHNSFVQSLVELGVFGGACFLGMFSYALATLHGLRAPADRIADGELRRMRPYLMAVVAAYAGGMLSLTRIYVMPTYLVAGLATAYLRVAAPVPAAPPLDGRLAGRLACLTAAFIVAIHLYVRTFARWGGG
jgi:putative inorganic carbon (hco3(-)) transporter